LSHHNQTRQRLSEWALEPLRHSGAALRTQLKTGKRGECVTFHQEVEGVGLDTHFTAPSEMGARAVNIALFQAVANGLKPETVWLNIGVNSNTNEIFWEEFLLGAKKSAEAHKVPLELASTSHSPTCFYALLAVRSRRLLPAKRPRPGDILAVGGTLGDAAAGLQCLKRFGWNATKDYPEITSRHLRPKPPTAVCSALLRSNMSISLAPVINGLSADLHAFCRKYSLGAWIDENALPVSSTTLTVAKDLGVSSRKWALFGPEDYTVLLSTPAKKWNRLVTFCKKLGLPLTAVGTVSRAQNGIKMKNIEAEEVELLDRSWNPLLRRKA
jgi:thiamine-monophosphate kinase